MKLSLYPIWVVDFTVSALVIVITLYALRVAYWLYRRQPDITLYKYLLLQSTALFVFASARATGHIVKRILILTGHSALWQTLSPLSGGINTLMIAIFPLVALLYSDFKRFNDTIAALNRERNRYRKLFKFKQTIFDSLMQPAMVINRNFEVVDVNRTYESNLSIKREQVLGKKCYEVSHGYQVPCENQGEPCPLRVVEETGRGYTIQHTHRVKGQKRIFEIMATPLFNEKGVFEAIIEVSRDVTDELLAQQQRKKMEEELYEMRKHMALRTAIGGIAHEFNNLLAAILGNAELMALKLGEDFPEKKRLLTIKKSAEKASELIRKMMLYEKAEFFSKTMINLNQLVEDVLSELKGRLPENISLICSYEPEELNIYADRGSIKQAVKNIYLNAVEAMTPEGGHLTLRTYKREVNENHYACLEVKDTGKGIPAENLSRIFDPFFTTKDVGEGEGLGLSVVKGIVDAHQGFIEVDSKPGEGSSFHICFLSF